MNSPTSAAPLLAAGGKRMTTFGIISIILGVLSMMAPMVAGLSIVLILGILLLFAGANRLVWAFKSSSLGEGILKFALAGLTLACGLLMVGNLLFASGFLTILLVAYLIADGVSEIAAGIGSGNGWFTFAGIISIVLGILLWRQFPLSGPWALGILLGIKLVFVGIIMLMGGSTAKAIAKG